MTRTGATVGAIMDRFREGSVFLPADLFDAMRPDQVYSALKRLVRSGEIQQLGHGLYHVPTHNPLLRRRSSGPSIDAIIDALARKTGGRFLPGDMYAANRLGLINPVGVRPLFLTDTRIGEYGTNADTRDRTGANVAVFGDREIHFVRKATARLAWSGRPAAMLVQAAYHVADLHPNERRRQVEDIQRIIVANPELANDLRAGIALLGADVRGIIGPGLQTAAEIDAMPIEEVAYAPKQ